MSLRTPAARYPYHQWANGDWHNAIRGKDFHVEPTHFRIALNAWARSNGLSVEFKLVGLDTFALRFRTGGPYCQSCDQPFTKKSSAHKFCFTCVPEGDIRARQLMSYYKLSTPRYAEMKAELPGGVCPICQVWEATAVDHDHACCGPVKSEGGTCGTCTRGLLCIGCNLMIEKVESGMITQVPETAQQYLLQQVQITSRPTI